MNKRLQVQVSDEAWQAIEVLCTEANQNFEGGNITISDAVNEMILFAKVDVRALQVKHTDIRKVLASMAKKEDLDLESVMRSLAEMKGKVGKKRGQTTLDEAS